MAAGEGDRALVVGIDFGGTKTDIGVAGPDGVLLRSERIDTAPESGARQAVERALAVARRMVGNARLLAAGAVSPGVVSEDGVLLAPNVPGWGDLRLPALLRAGLDLDAVTVGNDVNAAALAELRWGALRGRETALFVSLGTGVAAALVTGGAVYVGAHGAAGEIGYSLRDPSDDAGYRSGRAPLEEFVGGRAIGERASAALGITLTAAEAFGRPDLPAGFIDQTLAELSMHAANVALALDPEAIVIGGGLMAQADLILPALRARIDVALPFPPDVLPATFLHDGALRGALALALEGLPQEAEAAL